jgi:hypothetical protein
VSAVPRPWSAVFALTKRAGPPPSSQASTLAVLGLTALTTWIFREVLFADRVLYERDIHLVWEANSAAFVRAWRSGSWPLWDDSQGFGQSLVANPQAQVFYPPTWLALFLPFWASCAWYVVGHVLGSGVGFFALGRRLGIVPRAAFAGAALWIVCGPFLASASLWHHFAGAAWMPWVLLGLLAMRGRGGAAGLGLGSLPMAGQILAGSADLCVLTLALGGLLLLVTEADWARRLKAMAFMVGAALLALSLTAPQWLTSLEVLLRSARSDLGEAVRTYWSVHPVGLLDLALPIQLGWWPLRPEARAALYESREAFLPSLYLGLTALPFVLAGLAHPRRRLAWLFVGIGIGSVLFALGRYSPFYGALTALVPPLRIFRYPVKALFLAGFSWASLAGLGADVWLADGLPKKRRWAALFAGLGASLALFVILLPRIVAAWESRWLEPLPEAQDAMTRLLARHLGVAAGALVLAGLAAWKGDARLRSIVFALIAGAAVLETSALLVNPTAPRSLYEYRPAVFRAISAGPFARCYVYNYAARANSQERLGRASPLVPGAGLAMPAGSGSLAGALSLRSYMFPASAASWGLRYAFDLDMTGLAPREVVQLDQLLWVTEGTPTELRLLRLAGVSHVVTLHDARPDGLQPAGEFTEILADPVRLWRVPDPFPRVLVVGGARQAVGFEALKLLAEGSVDLTRQVLLPQGPAIDPPADFRGTSRVLEDRPGFLKVEAIASHPGHLVIQDAYAPGWTARLDGVVVPLLRANGAFRAIALPPGRHEVECRYLPAPISWGIGVSLVLGLATLVLIARDRVVRPGG